MSASRQHVLECLQRWRMRRTDAEVLAGLRALRAATPEQAWFDPVAYEEELQRAE
jgi:hypothetical protein